MSTLVPPKHVYLFVNGPANLFAGCDCYYGCDAELPYTCGDEWLGSDWGGKFAAKLKRANSVCKASIRFLASPGCRGITDVTLIGTCEGGGTGFASTPDCCGGTPGLLPSYGLAASGTVPAVTPPCSCENCPPAPESGPYPVRYATGELKLQATDLHSRGFGLAWGHTRSFANRLGLNHNSGNGVNWILDQLPYLQQATLNVSTYVVLMGSPGGGRWFLEQPGDVYMAGFGNKQLLTLDRAANVYRRQTPDGSVTEFHALTGEFLQQRTPGGNTLALVSRTSDNTRPAVIELTATANGVTTVEQFLYEYGQPSNILLSSVTLRRRQYTASSSSSSSGDDWTNVARVTYTYYDTADTYGAAGDLRTATTFVWLDADWAATGTSYYRYWTATSSSSSSSSGGGGGSTEAPHLLKYVLNPAAFDRLSADPDVPNPYSATNTQVALYADNYFEYDGSRRVTKEMVKGGSQTFLFGYASSAFSDNYNHWKTRTVETLPDGNQNIVYLNHAGQTMLKVFQSGDDRWIEFWQYNASARVILHAHPSAVSGYDDTHSDLLNYDTMTGKYQYLRDHDGLIDTYTIHAPSGSVASESLRRGQLGSSIKRGEYEYCCCGDNCCCGGSSSSSSSSGSGCASGVWFLKTETVYPSDSDQTKKLVTRHCYSFHTGTCAVKEHIVTLPVVGTDQNGSGVAATRREYFDSYGNLTWSMDERGFITRMVYDIPTGALTQQVADVDTSLYDDVPAGWSTPSGGGRDLVTDLEHDDQGRTTQTLGPSQSVDLEGDATTVRTVSWTIYDDVNHVTYSAQGYATGIAPDDEFTLIDPVSITRMDAGGRVNEQIQATAPSTSGTLAEIIEDAGGGSAAFPRSSYTDWTTMQYTDCCLAASQRVYHTIPTSGEGDSGTNYDETDFGYDVMKRRSRTVTPGGTITDLVYEARGMVVGTYIGTNDDGATADDPTGGGLDPDNNMVLVTESEYDDGTDGGDGNLTAMTQHVDDTTTRVTDLTDDFRDRRVTTDGEVDYFENSSHDNLDRVTESERYDTSEEGNLIARNETLFDDRGRVYQSIRYAVDPDTGDVGHSLTDNTWFDDASNVIKSLPSGSQLFTKNEYDSLNRSETRYTGYDLDETGYPD